MKKVYSFAAIFAAALFTVNEASAQIHVQNFLGNPLATQKNQLNKNTMVVSAVPAGRSNPTKVLGVPEDSDVSQEPAFFNFYSLGLDATGGANGGSITLEMERPFFNGPGIDLFIFETSYGSPSCANYPEKAEVWVAQIVCDPATSNPATEPSNWFKIGEVCATNGALMFEYSDAECLSWARYVHIQDRTIPAEFTGGGNIDGFDVDGVTAYHEVPADVKTSGFIFAESAVSYAPGLRKNGSIIQPTSGAARRNDPSRATGAPIQGISANSDPVNSFVSLGFGGEIILKLDRPIFNTNGDDADLLVLETTYNAVGRTCSSYPEHARVYGACSADGPWVELVAVESNLGGTVAQRIIGASSAGLTMGSSSICKDGKLDLGTLSTISYVKIVDNTRPNSFPGSADAFDVDAVVGINQCGTPEFRIQPGMSNVANEVTSIEVFPNPASDIVYFNIETSDVNEQINIMIVDNIGRVVKSANYNVAAQTAVVNTIDINELNAGIYHLVINTNGNKMVEKLIKQ